MGKMIDEFKEFALKGNVVDMAIGVVIGGAFGNIVTSLVNDIFMPIVSKLTGGVDFSNWFISLDGSKYATLAAAQEAGAATLNYGVLISTIINFLIIALCLFGVVKAMNARAGSAQARSEAVPLLQERDRRRRDPLPALHLSAVIAAREYLYKVFSYRRRSMIDADIVS